MRIRFWLHGMKEGVPIHRGFKSPHTRALFEHYVKLTGRYTPAEIRSGSLEKAKDRGTCLWLCHTDRRSQPLSSEALAKSADRIRKSGQREWTIGIGGPDGFSAEDVRKAAPDFLWNFGPLTLPHELAAVVAAEQIYRAWTILNRHPYHLDH